MRPINRIAPALKVQHMQTYELSAPPATHFRPASCSEVECKGYMFGWVSAIDEKTTLGQKQAYYIRMHSGRKFTQHNAAGITEFRFPAGQNCFSTHQVPLEREPLYIVRGGDWRGNPTRSRHVHTRPEHWVEDFAEHQDNLANRIQRG